MVCGVTRGSYEGHRLPVAGNDITEVAVILLLSDEIRGTKAHRYNSGVIGRGRRNLHRGKKIDRAVALGFHQEDVGPRRQGADLLNIKRCLQVPAPMHRITNLHLLEIARTNVELGLVNGQVSFNGGIVVSVNHGNGLTLALIRDPIKSIGSLELRRQNTGWDSGVLELIRYANWRMKVDGLAVGSLCHQRSYGENESNHGDQQHGELSH